MGDGKIMFENERFFLWRTATKRQLAIQTMWIERDAEDVI